MAKPEWMPENPCEGCDAQNCDERNIDSFDDGESLKCPAHIFYRGGRVYQLKLLDYLIASQVWQSGFGAHIPVSIVKLMKSQLEEER